MNVAYLTIEDVSSGLFKTQILDIIDEIITQEKSIKCKIFIVNRPWHYSKHKKYLKEYSLKYGSKNIIFYYIPLLPPLRDSLKYYLYSLIVTRWLSLIFKFFLDQNKFDLIHSRSYWPTFAVLDYKLPIIFDLRSLWVLENISSGDIVLNSKTHHYWKRLEFDCVDRTAVSTCVSNEMVKYVNDLSKIEKTELIPISVNENNFKHNVENRIKNREILSWNDNVIFVYSGSLGLSGINISAIIKLFKNILDVNCTFRILILTSDNGNYVNDIFLKGGLEIEKIKILHPKLDDISGWLDCSDIGLHALPLQLDSKTRLGTKVVEYWVNGLPVIVNRHVGAAAEYIDNYKVGFVIEDFSQIDNLEIKILELLDYDREMISNFAISNFSSKLVASKYLKIYKELYGNTLR